MTADVLTYIEQLVQGQPDITRAELAERLAWDGIVRISPSTVGQALHVLRLTRKKSLHASERDTPEVCQAREDYLAQVV